MMKTACSCSSTRRPMRRSTSPATRASAPRPSSSKRATSKICCCRKCTTSPSSWSCKRKNQAKKVPKRLLRNLLYELFHCKVYRLVNVSVRAGTDAGGVVGERFERENALIREDRHFPVPQCDGADPRALAAALPLHPEAPEIGVICRVKARTHRAAHRAKAAYELMKLLHDGD